MFTHMKKVNIINLINFLYTSKEENSLYHRSKYSIEIIIFAGLFRKILPVLYKIDLLMKFTTNMRVILLNNHVAPRLSGAQLNIGNVKHKKNVCTIQIYISFATSV